jgi:hypothetical protein
MRSWWEVGRRNPPLGAHAFEGGEGSGGASASVPMVFI